MCVLMGEHCDYCMHFWIDEDDPSGRGFPCQYNESYGERPCDVLMMLVTPQWVFPEKYREVIEI